MKVLERALGKSLRPKVSTDGMEFGFMFGKGTTDPIFVIQQLQEKFL